MLSTIKLQCGESRSKALPLHPLDVSADDRIIQKKDKNMDEPVQFYTGRDPVLGELVVNSIEKNKVTDLSFDSKRSGSAMPYRVLCRYETGALFASPVCLP